MTNENGVSEIVGAILLVALVILAMMIVAVALLSQPPPQEIPQVNALAGNNTSHIFIQNNGGDSLTPLETIIRIDGNPDPFPPEDITLIDENGNYINPWTTGDWSVGSTLVIKDNQPPKSVSLIYSGGSSQALIFTATFVQQPITYPTTSPLTSGTTTIPTTSTTTTATTTVTTTVTTTATTSPTPTPTPDYDKICNYYVEGSAYKNPDGTCSAKFGYCNNNSFPVTINISDSPNPPWNEFTGNLKDLGQPTLLQPGCHIPSNEFWVVFDETIHWKLSKCQSENVNCQQVTTIPTTTPTTTVTTIVTTTVPTTNPPQIAKNTYLNTRRAGSIQGQIQFTNTNTNINDLSWIRIGNQKIDLNFGDNVKLVINGNPTTGNIYMSGYPISNFEFSDVSFYRNGNFVRSGSMSSQDINIVSYGGMTSTLLLSVPPVDPAVWTDFSFDGTVYYNGVFTKDGIILINLFTNQPMDCLISI